MLQQARQHARRDTEVWEEDGERGELVEGFPAGPRTTARVNRRTRAGRAFDGEVLSKKLSPRNGVFRELKPSEGWIAHWKSGRERERMGEGSKQGRRGAAERKDAAPNK